MRYPYHTHGRSLITLPRPASLVQPRGQPWRQFQQASTAAHIAKAPSCSPAPPASSPANRAKGTRAATRSLGLPCLRPLPTPPPAPNYSQNPMPPLQIAIRHQPSPASAIAHPPPPSSQKTQLLHYLLPLTPRPLELARILHRQSCSPPPHNSPAFHRPWGHIASQIDLSAALVPSFVLRPPSAGEQGTTQRSVTSSKARPSSPFS